jgi:hypothetical protein
MGSVFRYLRESGIPLERTQYERLVETHVAAGDLPAAINFTLYHVRKDTLRRAIRQRNLSFVHRAKRFKCSSD